MLSKSIFASLRKADKTIVQTQWIMATLVDKAWVKAERIAIDAPDITMNNIGTFEYTQSNRRIFFYPATAFTYKNHMSYSEG